MQTPTNETIQAIKYNVEICLDFEHNHYTHITEIFVPELDIAFNYFSTQLNVFECKAPRYLTTRTEELIYTQEYINKLKEQKDKKALAEYGRQQQKTEDRFQENQKLANPATILLDRKFVENLVTFLTLKAKINSETFKMFAKDEKNKN